MKRMSDRLSYCRFLWVLFIVMGVCVACTSSRKAVNSKTESLELPQGVAGNSILKLLLADIHAQRKSHNIGDYVPSSEVCAIVSLQDNLLSGKLQVDDAFDAKSVEQRGIVVNYISGTFYTFRCKITQLPVLLQAQGVKRVELSGKVQKRAETK